MTDRSPPPPAPRPISRLLIANRGEIALRIQRSARARGIDSIAIASDADRDAPHARAAEACQVIGPAPAAQSYLDIDRVLAAAQASGADAVHPGYGFLSESAAFARAVTAAGLIFVGPPAEAIAAMGNKAEAKARMAAAGVPCVPGSTGSGLADDALIAAGANIGFPLMVKAAAGGGGRGMRQVERSEDLPEALRAARAEALAGFGADDLILERVIHPARHVEIQIFADSHGQILHLGERDCSLQRRHQKIIEEAPSPAVTPDLRARMGAAAIAAARAVGYIGAGTVEFLLDEAGQFYFLEMNTRLQVEHPVTEMITGLDLVDWQLRIAQGHPLPLTQDEVRLHGHAIEARLYAEDPARAFMPATGRLLRWDPPEAPGVRVDEGVATGQEIGPHYDPLLAKIVAHGATRAQALARLDSALSRLVALGVTTNAPFLRACLASAQFDSGQVTTAFLDNEPDLAANAVPPAGAADIALAAAIFLGAARDRARAASPGIPDALIGWSGAGALHSVLSLSVEGRTVPLRLVPDGSGACDVTLDGAVIRADPSAEADAGRAVWAFESRDVLCLQTAGIARRFTRLRPGHRAPGAGAGDGSLRAPLPGVVVDLRVAEGDRVIAGQTLLVIEAMKMQHAVPAPGSGRIARLAVKPGDQLAAGADGLTLIPEETPDA